MMAKPLATLLLLGGLVYVNALFGRFVWDDISLIVLNDHLRSWRSLPVLLTSDMYRYLGVHVSDYYRPLTMLTFFLDHQLWGLRSFGYHLTSVVLHLVTAVLVYRVWARLGTREAALIGALLWTVHPAHVEAVAYISSRGEILYTLWGLVAVLLVLNGRDALSLVALGAALLSKESAVIVPAILGLVGFARGWGRKKLALYLGACAVVVLAFALLRVSLGIALTLEHGRTLPVSQRGLLALKVFGLYGELMAWPVDLHFPRPMPVIRSLWEPAVLLGVLFLGSGLALVGMAWKRWPAVAAGIAWFFVGLLPVSNLLLLNVPLAEHWLYFPAVGLCGAAGLAVAAAERRAGKLAMAVTVGLVVALLSVRTVVGIGGWRDELTVALKATRGNPDSLMSWRYLGTIYVQRREIDPAVAALERALQIEPRDPLARRFLGQTLAIKGDYVEAEKQLRLAASLDGQKPWAHHMLAEALVRQGRTEEALAAWQKALEVDPLFERARTRLREVGPPGRGR